MPTSVKTMIVALAILILASADAWSAAGDYKHGYETQNYVTRSVSLDSRAGRGKPTDLVSNYRKPPLGLPPVPAASDNPVTPEKVTLGRKLFFDRRLSLNDTISCAMCHVPEQGFANNELALAVGLEGRTVRRNAPTIYNMAYFKRLFHDGRENRLEQQVWLPLLAHNKMANPSVGAVKQFGVEFPVLIDAQLSLTNWEVRGLPRSYLLDPKGCIVYRRLGAIDRDEAESRHLMHRRLQAGSKSASSAYNETRGRVTGFSINHC